MNASVTPNLTAQTASCADSKAPKRHWFSALWQRVHHQPVAGIAGQNPQYDPWTSAVSQIDHLDSHVLADIGAPRWVIEEVNRRQQNDTILNAGRKW